ncbi:MAG: family transposase [Brevibacillus sp.]|nr:family transposase [Brevibacillus sp.]
MLFSNKEKQTSYELVCIEELVPQDHLLRIIDRYIYFSFITEKDRPFYCENNGRIFTTSLPMSMLRLGTPRI